MSKPLDILGQLAEHLKKALQTELSVQMRVASGTLINSIEAVVKETMSGFEIDPYARERYFAVRDQQHAEDQVGNNGGQLREKRVEQPAGDHRDRQHPVLELLQYHAWYVM